MTIDKYVIWNTFLRKTFDPKAAQEKVLRRILNKNKNTRFGKEHKFSSVRSYKDYQKAVPVQNYEDLEPYIERQIETKNPELTGEQPILYARTSGTTSKPKFIPILQSTVNAYKWGQRIFLYAQYVAFRDMFSGYLLAIAGPAVEGYLDNGVPYGSMSGLVYKEMPWFTKRKFLLPPEVFSIENYDAKYIVIAAFALARKNITAMGSANPSTFVKLLDVINTKWQDIIYIIRTGDFSKLHDLKEKDDISKYFYKNPRRADELEQIFIKKERVIYADLWPNLKVVSTWTAGSCSILIPVLRESLSTSTRIVETGYFASEFRGSINVDVKNNRAVPTLHETFFEFVEKDKWEGGAPQFHTIETIEPGKQYYIFITTASGLYRYHMNDIVEVTGYFNKTPTIIFVQKGKGVTNITGEKLYEGQVLKVLQELEKERIIEPTFFILLADDRKLQYTLYLESKKEFNTDELACIVDSKLSLVNIEYDAKRKSGRLKPPQIIFLKQGAGDAYKKEAIANGTRENQFKVLPLHYKRDFTFNIEQFAQSR